MTQDQTAQQKPAGIGLVESTRHAMALLFTVLFLTFSAYLTVLAVLKFLEVFGAQQEVIETLIKSINLGIIGLAIFELAMSIHKEHGACHHDADFFPLLRRGVARFVGVVCIALVMEGLIMAIKYSQLDLAGNLNYAVAIVVSAAVLLAALGVFLKLSDPARPAPSTHPVQPQTLAPPHA